ncbi:MAG: hypothetical protein QHH07_10440 [Sedimentisphaerales bacterium]|nr:hypothetical protein [Sedimentisphaerales bacterium]
MSPVIKRILQFISICGIVLTVAPSFAFFAGLINRSTYLDAMLLGTVMWFGTAVFWVKGVELG